ncbi:MAG TPA: RodZ domain-containing protein [Roseiflexaceae bacterium]|nr:RodZ domain-containing protein [Roseiflexaceae bacterium]
MSQLGERLRTARESQGISLAQAAAETRILQRYLVALEDSDYQHLPGDVYARGFIRNYANYLGISPEELIDLYRRERGVTDPIRVVPVTKAPRIRGVFVPSFFGVFFVVLILIALGYLALSATNGLNSQIASVPTATPGAPTPEPLPTSAPQPTQAPVVAVATAPPSEAAGGTLPTPAPTQTPLEAPIVFEVSVPADASSGSWLRIETDGERVYQDVLDPGLALRYTAQRQVIMRAGNAGVVAVVVNGQVQPRLGQQGQVVTFVWPPQ